MSTIPETGQRIGAGYRENSTRPSLKFEDLEGKNIGRLVPMEMVQGVQLLRWVLLALAIFEEGQLHAAFRLCLRKQAAYWRQMRNYHDRRIPHYGRISALTRAIAAEQDANRAIRIHEKFFQTRRILARDPRALLPDYLPHHRRLCYRDGRPAANGTHLSAPWRS